MGYSARARARSAPPYWKLAAHAILVSGDLLLVCGLRNGLRDLREPSTRRYRSSGTFVAPISWAGFQQRPVARFPQGLGGAWLLAAHTAPAGCFIVGPGRQEASSFQCPTANPLSSCSTGATLLGVAG
ncbi:hypothetical protein HJG60_008721 [Phyllostomus discolor]|uniref:Uncharacterized protein n=1 Tax=Phyllostomus discolor TaxID=89673 RepID=A0A833YW51_9CHIR|nr:hypothetical protein HJG60_008721 [Phyllostomus discolor]